MPILILFFVASIAGSLVFLLGSRYPTPVVGQAAAQAAGQKLGHEAVRHPWLSRTLRSRLDPAAATGLALTVALVAAMTGGLVLGLLAYLMRTNAQLVEVDNSVGQWEIDHATHLRHRRSSSSQILLARTSLSSSSSSSRSPSTCASPTNGCRYSSSPSSSARSSSSRPSKEHWTGCGPASTRPQRRSARRFQAVIRRRRPPSTQQWRSCWHVGEHRAHVPSSPEGRRRSQSRSRAAA